MTVCVTIDGRLRWSAQPKSNPLRACAMIGLCGEGLKDKRLTTALLADEKSWRTHPADDPIAMAIRSLRRWYRDKHTRVSLCTLAKLNRRLLVVHNGVYYPTAVSFAYAGARQAYEKNQAVLCEEFAGFGAVAVLLPWLPADVAFAGFGGSTADDLVNTHKPNRARAHHALEREAERILKRTIPALRAKGVTL